MFTPSTYCSRLSILTTSVLIIELLVSSRAMPAEMTECLRQARVLPASIQSIDYRYGLIGDSSERRFVIEGDRWYFGFAENRDSPMSREFTYNGETYEQKVAGEFLSFSNATLLPKGQVEIHPLVRAYTWFVEDSAMLTLSDLHDQQKWTEAISRMVYDGKNNFNGKECETYVIKYPQKTYRVHFSVTDGGYPVLVESERSRGRKSELRTTELKKVDGSVIGMRLIGSSAKVRMEFWVDEESLRVNKPIDASIFSLTPDNTSEIIDIDQMRERNEQLRAKSGSVPIVVET